MSTAQAIAAREVSFHYDFLSVQDLRVETSTNVKTGKKTVDKVFVKDEPLDATERFWTSLYARFGFNSAVMKYFSHEEVFTRISQVEPKDRMRLCIERGPSGDGSLLGVSNPDKPIVVYDELMDTLGRYRGDTITYHSGIVEFQHAPRAGINTFQVGGDDFVNRFIPVSYTHLTLPTIHVECRSRWSPCH